MFLYLFIAALTATTINLRPSHRQVRDEAEAAHRAALARADDLIAAARLREAQHAQQVRGG
jgi:hypothetical protein